MLKRYFVASIIAVVRYTVGGIGSGLTVVGSLVEVAFQQACEDLNAERLRQVGGVAESEENDLKPEDLN